MALTKGITGTFAPVDYEYIGDVSEPAGVRKIKKSISVNGVFEEHNFYMITAYIGSWTRASLSEWCEKHYGKPSYLNTYWLAFDNICMNEKIYVHWKLCE